MRTRITYVGTVLDSLLREAFVRMVHARMRGVWVRGAPPSGPAVWAANHHSWWDPFVAHALLGLADRETGVVMDDANLAGFPFLRRVGVLGTRELKAVTDEVRRGRVMIIFPEGELRPAGPPGPIARGAAWLAGRADAQLLSVGMRVTMRGHEAPEAYVDVVPVRRQLDPLATTTRLAETMRASLADIDALIAESDPRLPLPGFRQAVRGRRSWDERLSRRRPGT